METLAANSQQPPEELVHEVTALEARRANLEATLTRMGSVEDPRPRPIQPDFLGRRFHAHYLDIADEPQYAPAAQGDYGWSGGFMPRRFFQTHDIEVWCQAKRVAHTTTR
ncbi:hypothetical protein R1flu_017285 [Riccia fluitans]|uniref:Uncharacterized protein n=1 Tax=Riccia fluitans TaxID=41844 RepID=A0ABD1XDS7_9MARC